MGQRYSGDSGGDSGDNGGNSGTAQWDSSGDSGTVGQWDSGWGRGESGECGTVVGTVVVTVGTVRQWWGHCRGQWG
eukprot:3512125-Pyramimonas_sp.AAC.1